MSTSLKIRDHRIDNAKGILIFMVVFGHLLEAASLWVDPSVRLILTMLYISHMPAFVFLAGITSKPTNILRRVGSFAVWLIAFQALYAVATVLTGGDPQLSPLLPFWILWFLMAMMWWTLALPAIVKLRRASVAISILVSVGCGMIPFVGYTLTLSRAMVFLPFFVIGTLYGKDIVAAAAGFPVAAKGALIAASIALGWGLYASGLQNDWLYGSSNYMDLGFNPWVGVLVRAGLLVTAGVVIIAFLSVMSSVKGKIAQIGSVSLSIFLLHGFVVLALEPVLPSVMANAGSLAAIAVCLIVAVLTVVLFSAPKIDESIRRLATVIVDPVIAKLDRRKPDPLNR